MDSQKKFAVVYFKIEKMYSEIPVSWLTSDKTQCWWPNSLNPRNRMVRGDEPNTDDTAWVLYEIKFELYASTLESARKKAEEPNYLTGHEDLVLGPRQRISKNVESSFSSSDITPPPTPRGLVHKKNASKKQLRKVKDKIEKSSSSESLISLAVAEAGIVPKIDKYQTVEAVQDTADNGQHTIMTETVQIHPDPDVQDKIPFIVSKGNPSMAELHLEMQQLSIVCKTMHKYLISIDKRLKDIILEKGNMEINENLEFGILSKLPCTTTEEIENFDQDISNNEEFKKSFVQYTKRMGGRDVKDNVNRCLPCLFSNKLGTKCSYVGFRGNFKLQDFTFMKLFMEIMMLQHNSTIHEVEKCVGEWFRLSHQREKREKKVLK